MAILWVKMLRTVKYMAWGQSGREGNEGYKDASPLLDHIILGHMPSTQGVCRGGGGRKPCQRKTHQAKHLIPMVRTRASSPAPLPNDSGGLRVVGWLIKIWNKQTQ